MFQDCRCKSLCMTLKAYLTRSVCTEFHRMNRSEGWVIEAFMASWATHRKEQDLELWKSVGTWLEKKREYKENEDSGWKESFCPGVVFKR